MKAQSELSYLRQWMQVNRAKVAVRLFGAMLAGFLTVSVSAQLSTGDVLGTITDPTGAIVTWATITIKNLDSIAAVGLLPGDVPTSANGFGIIGSTVPNVNPRQFQFAVKLLF